MCEFTDNIKEHGKYLQIDIKHPLLGSYHIKRYKYFFYFQGRRKKKKKRKPWKDKPPTCFLFLLSFFLSTIPDSPKSFHTRKQSPRLGKFVDLNRFVCFTINHAFCWRNFLVLKYLSSNYLSWIYLVPVYVNLIHSVLTLYERMSVPSNVHFTFLFLGVVFFFFFFK